MIAVDLISVVVDEPVDDPGVHGAMTEPVRLFAPNGMNKRIRYLPQLALVVINHGAGYATIVPIEHVHHMTTTVDELDVVDVLGSVLS